MSEQSYIPYPYAFTSKGLVALFARDRAPEGTFFNLEGLEVRQEGALSSRLGRTAITTDGTNNFPVGTVNFPVLNLARLKSTGVNTYRYASGGAFFWRRSGDTNGAYTSIPTVGGVLGASRFSAVTYRPSFSSTPYIFFAGQENMVKDNGTLSSLQHWGVLPPFGYVVATLQAALILTLSSVATSSGGQAVYTGTITGGGANAFAGFQFQVAGFVGANNNGVFICVASTATTLTLLNAVATVEVHAATATQTGPDVTGNANNYDYRMTLYNQNTGGESNPTATFVSKNTVAPVSQAVVVSWSGTTFSYSDMQATHFRIYRRGGTLPAQWLLISTIPPSNSGSFVDSLTDAQIATNQPLVIDNDPPVTTTLASQFNSTTSGATVAGGATMTVNDSMPGSFYPWQVVIVDSGANQEIILITIPTGNPQTQFLAYFQLPHASGVPIVVNSKPQQFMNLAAIGSQQAFLAGDPVNPNRLYYSKPQNPEAFPPQNYIEIGVPSDPIMAVMAIRGQVFVFTQSRIYRILSFGGGTPQAIPTGSRHGLSANFAWAIAEQSIIYLSYDGVYSFLADDSTYISEQIEWVFSDKQPNLGPLDPLDSTKRSSAIAAYNKGEFFLCYTGVSGSKRRMIYDTVNKRWRNDSVSCDAMFFEEDTGELIISELGDGMIYKDRRSDWDQEGFVASVRQSVAIPLNLETFSMDQGYPRNDKVYNEFTLDLDTGGSTLNVFLLFDNAATVVSLGTVNGGAGRKQVTFPINSGNGQVSKNVALRITGSVSPTVTAVHLYQWHIKAAVDAEQRKTFDTYWAKMGTDEFKFLKQGYFEILAPDPGGIAFNVYLEGSATAAYSFSLPQALVRTSVKVRFPAFKAKLWRFVATSAGDFKLYGESFLEFKPVTSDKGYGKFPFGQVTAQGGV